MAATTNAAQITLLGGYKDAFIATGRGADFTATAARNDQFVNMNNAIGALTVGLTDPEKAQIVAILADVQKHINELTDAANRAAEQLRLDNMKAVLEAAPYEITFPPVATLASVAPTAATSGNDDLLIKTDDNKELHYKPGYDDLFGPDKHGHTKTWAEIFIAAWNDYRSQALKHYLSRFVMIFKARLAEQRLDGQIKGLEKYQAARLRNGLPENRDVTQQIADLKARRDSIFAGNGGFSGALATAFRDQEFHRGPPASYLAIQEKKLIDSYIHNGVTGYSPALWYYAPRNAQNPNGSAFAVKLARLKGFEDALIEREMAIREREIGVVGATGVGHVLAEPVRTATDDLLSGDYRAAANARARALDARERVVTELERTAVQPLAATRARTDGVTPVNLQQQRIGLRVTTPVAGPLTESQTRALEMRAETMQRISALNARYAGPTLTGQIGDPNMMRSRRDSENVIHAEVHVRQYNNALADSQRLPELAPAPVQPIGVTVTTPRLE